MKKILFLLAGLILGGFTVNATNTNINSEYNFNNSYGERYIFIENGIEFSVFPDGQFDFNIPRYHSNLNVNIGSPNVNISFNSGYNYNAYIQYDEFGAIIQIENTPVYYDYYGRVAQAGNVNINYNNHGFINRVGGLYVHYNNYNRFSHTSGFINRYNRDYVFRPWHRGYIVPAINYCVVYNRPYRQYYSPVRYTFNRSFYNNYRPRTAVATRRGNVIHRNRSYATVNRSSRNVTKVNNYNSRAYRDNSSSTTRRPTNQVNNSKFNSVVSNNLNNQSINRKASANTNRNLGSRVAVINNTRRNSTVIKRQAAPSNTRKISANTISMERNTVSKKTRSSNSAPYYSNTTTRRAPQAQTRKLENRQNTSSRPVQRKVKTVQRSSTPNRRSVTVSKNSSSNSINRSSSATRKRL